MIPSHAIAAAPVAMDEALTTVGALYLSILSLATLAGMIARGMIGANG